MSDRVKGYITVQEAAERLERSTEQVRRYLREGKLAGERIGGQWFIREPAVLYRTGKETEVMPGEPRRSNGEDAMTVRNRAEVIQQINRRRQEISHRWEALGIRINVVEIIRELREEEP